MTLRPFLLGDFRDPSVAAVRAHLFDQLRRLAERRDSATRLRSPNWHAGVAVRDARAALLRLPGAEAAHAAGMLTPPLPWSWRDGVVAAVADRAERQGVTP